MKKKCYSEEIDRFYYHDAFIDSAEIMGSDMLWKTNGVCIDTANSQNDEDYDTISEYMELRFFNYKITDIIKCGYAIYDSKNILQARYENINLEGREFDRVINEFFDNDSTIRLLGHDNMENGCWFDIELNNEIYGITVSYEKFTARWEYTDSAAWYVK